MPCLHHMRINAVNSSAPKRSFIPCGRCPECRESAKRSWASRIRFEFEKAFNENHHVAFCTLTYDNEHLPKFPVEAFQDGKFKEIPCFSRGDVRLWLDDIRKFLNKYYAIKAIKYIVASEYGSNYTKRPHYHALLGFPKFGVLRSGKKVSLSGEFYHALVKRYWKNGHVFPRYFDGGRDAKGYDHKPFIVDSVASAAVYAGKYMCKDIGFFSTLDLSIFNLKNKAYKRCLPFHAQSRSLGLCILDELSDDVKMSLLLDGMHFVGSEKLVSVPLYIRNKVLFDNDYQYVKVRAFDNEKMEFATDENGAPIFETKRLVRRKASEFFKNHFEKFFEKKVDIYEQIFSSATSASYFTNRKVPCALAENISSIVREAYKAFGHSSKDFSKLYLAYFGVSYPSCFDVDLSLQWFSRYTQIDFGNAPLIPRDDYEVIQCVCDCILDPIKNVVSLKDVERQDYLDYLHDKVTSYERGIYV